MLSEFEQTVAGFIVDNDLFSPSEKIVLAVSGGADSMALLYCIWSLKAAGILPAELVCAHINHQLRGREAGGDEEFVKTQACRLNLEVATRRVDVRRFARQNKLSIETAARQLRIEALLDIARLSNCCRVATAHQKDDNAETIIQRLARGTGFRGLGGIRPAQVFPGDICFVRPLLCVSRDQIVDYLKKRSLKWRYDSTNSDCAYRRNFIRHRLLPELQRQCSSSLPEQLFELSQSARRLCRFVGAEAERVWPRLAERIEDGVVMDVKGFLSQPQVVQVELIRRTLLLLGAGERNLTRGHFRMIAALAGRGISGKRIELPGGFLVWREYRRLLFARTGRALKKPEQTGRSVNLKVPGQTRLARYLLKATILENEDEALKKFKRNKTEFIEWFDLDKLGWPLSVRFRRAGDRFRPLGSAGRKRVGKFLTDMKAPAELRNNVIIVCDKKRIIWVAPIRIGEDARVTGNTRKILQLEITDIGGAKMS